MTTGTELDRAAAGRPGGLELLATAGGGIAAAADSSTTVLWAQRVALAAQTFDLLIDTPMVPTSFWTLPPGVRLSDWPQPWIKHPRESEEGYAHRRRSTAAATAAAALWGEGLGLDVPQSLEGIHVIQGRPGLKAELVLALLLANRYRVRRIERSATRAALAIAEPGSEEFEEFEFTFEQAVRAGFVKDAEHPKGNDKYNTQPEVMLWHRAVTTAARIVAAHVLRGMATDVELEDEPERPARGTVTASVVADAERKAVGAGADTLRSALADQLAVREAQASVALDKDPEGGTHAVDDAVQVEDPPADGPVVLGYGAADEDPAAEHGAADGDPDEAEHRPITTQQTRHLAFLFGGQIAIGGPGSKAERAHIASVFAGRDVESATELTQAEADRVIAELERLGNREAVRAEVNRLDAERDLRDGATRG